MGARIPYPTFIPLMPKLNLKIADALHHWHIRRRVHKELEPYPHPQPLKRFIDHLIYLVAFLGPLLAIPQVAKIWLAHEVDGVSLVTWAGLAAVALVWLTYGFVHNARVIILAYTLWLIMDLIIVAGILLYR